MEDNLFTKIINKDIPSDIIYEDDETLAFLDIFPNNPGHTLVVPKQYSRNIFDISEKSLHSIISTARKIAPAILRAVNADGINIIMNNEQSAGQVIFYTHVHLIPRFENDGYKNWQGKKYTDGEAEKIARSIRKII